MNIQERDILKSLLQTPFSNQRTLSDKTGHSLGVVNRSIRALTDQGYLNSDVCLTEKAKEEFREKAPQRAIILAAGFGMRMVPINTMTPKAFLEVDGEPLIERQIKQLHAVGVTEIYVVVGFMKEQFEYLIDDFDVKLIVNPDYASRNNLYSMYLAMQHLSNAYVIPADIWCDKNPFHHHELYSWYMVSDLIDDDSEVRANRKMELARVGKHESGNTMIGIAYLLEEDAKKVRENLLIMADDPKYDSVFWEEALYSKDRMMIPARIVHASGVVEINTYEQLRELDSGSAHLQSDAIDTIAQTLHAQDADITDITVLKKGMTNRSFLFTCRDQKYIMRIPGEGTDKLINREQEAAVYQAIRPYGLCDDPVYLNPQNGYKITSFLNGVRTCDPDSTEDLVRCMKKLHELHDARLQVEHSFDIFGQIAFYESLWEGKPSAYRDYQRTKERVLSLKPFIDSHVETRCLTHIDAVPDNFLFYRDENGAEQLQLTDWEYAGMQDPHVDLAMFCIYSLYGREQVERLIDLYFENQCPPETRTKIYCYIASCGLLWSNWCEYKRNLGVEFGEYSLMQYRYAKEYYKIAKNEMRA